MQTFTTIKYDSNSKQMLIRCALIPNNITTNKIRQLIINFVILKLIHLNSIH